MNQKVEFRRIAVLPLAAAAAVVLTTFVLASTAGAAARNMIGSIFVENPSAGFTLLPGVYGRKVGGLGPNLFPPTDGVPVVDVLGTTTGTSVGRQVTVPASVLNRNGVAFRDFPSFGNVAQLTKTFMTVQQAPATFAENQGALAECPGDGCTASGAGTQINWCPPLTHNTAAPAPGTVAAKIGNWDCPGFGSAGAEQRRMRMTISNVSGRPNFGGTLTLLRDFTQNLWRVPGAPSSPDAQDAQATRSVRFINIPWPGGLPNFEFGAESRNPGPRVFAQLNANGAIAATFGCVNGVGTPGGSYMQGVVNTNPGSNCGTNTGPQSPGQDWGFKMTTGVVSGSDDYPFGLVVTTIAGTPFNPTFTNVPASLGFFFSRHGGDSITGSGNRNIVLIGGGLSVDPGSGNAFFRMTDLRMNLSVPEPATGLGLIAGAGMLVGFARRRRQT